VPEETEVHTHVRTAKFARSRKGKPRHGDTAGKKKSALEGVKELGEVRAHKFMGEEASNVLKVGRSLTEIGGRVRSKKKKGGFKERPEPYDGGRKNVISGKTGNSTRSNRGKGARAARGNV